jgi:hypothetical protein
MSYDKFAQSAQNRAKVQETHRADHLAKLAAGRLKPLDWGSELKIRRQDVAVFAAAALAFDHIIGVRATNPASLQYVDRTREFTPKPIDCKPKTADCNAYVTETGMLVECAGLVVDPTVTGPGAFKDKKSDKAREAWNGFLKDKSDEERTHRIFRRRETKGFYAVDIDRRSKQYGCLMLCEQNIPGRGFSLALTEWQEFKRTNMRYIHGDYDLYGLIDADMIEKQVRGPGGRDKLSPELLRERLHGVPHVYTKQFPEIRDFLNGGIGAEMIQHASQDNVGHQDDEIYVFYPFGGKYRLEASADDIRDIYLRLFQQDVVT